MADDLSLVSSAGIGGMSSSDPSLSSLSPPINDPSLRLYQCAVCNCYSTDSLEALNAHVNAERSLAEEEWRCVVGDVYQCKLCSYNTQLKANFQLHCKTDKHMQKHQLVAHIKEGGKANQWRLKCVAIGNPVHLKCNACDYYSNSVDKLRLHATNQRHESAIRLYKVKTLFTHAVSCKNQFVNLSSLALLRYKQTSSRTTLPMSEAENEFLKIIYKETKKHMVLCFLQDTDVTSHDMQPNTDNRIHVNADLARTRDSESTYFIFCLFFVFGSKQMTPLS